jgi:hypothetical protein
MANRQITLMAMQAGVMSKSFGAMAESHKKFSSSLRESNDQMSRMAALSQKFGGGVFGTIGHVAGGNGVAAVETAVSTLGNLLPGFGKIAAIIAGVGTAALAAGKKLADDAIGDERNARRVGVSTGQLRSFDLNFGRYADPSMLNRAADAQSDLGKIPYAMMATGQSINQIQNEGADQVAIAMMQRAHDWWNRTPATMRSRQTLMATGLDKFMSFEDVRQLGAMTDKEFSEAKKNYSRNSPQFDVSGKSTDALYDFSRGFDEKTMRAKAGMQNGAGSLIDFLTGSAPKDASRELHRVAVEAKRAADAFAGLNPGPQPVKRTDNHPLGTIAASNNQALLEAGQIVRGMGGMGSLGAHPAATNPATKESAKKLGIYVADMVSTTANASEISPGLWKQAGPDAVKWALQGQQKYGVPAAVTLAQFGLESGFGKHMPPSSNNPFGMHAAKGQDYVMGYDWDEKGNRVPTKFRKFQSLEEAFEAHAKLLATGAAYAEARKHRDNPRDFADALTGRYATDPQYGSKLKRQMGWNSDLHPDTKKHIERVATAAANRNAAKVQVNITNSTSARVAVSTNAAATGS